MTDDDTPFHEPLFDGVDAVSEDETEFRVYHQANPSIEAELIAHARKLIQEGKTRIGMDELYWGARRAPILVEGADYKLPNDLKPYYARLLSAKHADIARVLKIKSLHDGKPEPRWALILWRDDDLVGLMRGVEDETGAAYGATLTGARFGHLAAGRMQFAPERTAAQAEWAALAWLADTALAREAPNTAIYVHSQELLDELADGVSSRGIGSRGIENGRRKLEALPRVAVRLLRPQAGKRIKTLAEHALATKRQADFTTAAKPVDADDLRERWKTAGEQQVKFLGGRMVVERPELAAPLG